MKKLLTAALLLAGMVAVTGFSSCKKKPKDADIKAAIEKALAADPATAATMVAVEKGVATLTGQCKDDACKTNCETVAKGVKGVKEVVSQLTVVPPVEITADDPLTKAVADAVKDYAGVTATVKDGVITLTGEIARDRLQKLMMALNGLKPKKVDASALVKK
jgi:hyperosmotically inducible periplasmic protein